ncbi:MAG: hypothetical protein WBD20_13555 [Pirellulaceae bacterium]
MSQNPYSPPPNLPTDDETPVMVFSRIPKPLLRRTRQSLAALGFSTVVLPLLAMPIVDGFNANLIGFFAFVVAVESHPGSFKRFPRTLFLCAFVIFCFFYTVSGVDWADLSNWFPRHESLGLLIPMLSAASAVWAGHNVWKSHRHHVAAATTASCEDDI